MVWMAFHFREQNANWLTNAAFDPDTLTAEYKACAVRIEKMQAVMENNAASKNEHRL
jgi:formate dehydrogenase major subunit